ncbi:MAG: hypothetical protein ACRENE_05110, partial [Polyangiaceae bacterium]
MKLRAYVPAPARPVRVCLIRPPSVVARFGLTLNATPPLSVAYLAGSLLDAGHEVTVVDAVGEAPTRFSEGFRDDVVVNGLDVAGVATRVPDDTELIGISCLFSHEWPLIRALVGVLAARFPG